MESYCNPLFCKCDGLYKSNLKAVQAAHPAVASAFESAIVLQSGRWAGQVPKFRYEPSWWADWQHRSWVGDFTELDAVMLCCSWGLGQKWGLAYVIDTPQVSWMDNLRLLMGNETLQIAQMYKDLEQCFKSANGDRALMFTKYNAGTGAKLISTYGRKALDFADHMAKLEAQGSKAAGTAPAS